MDQLSTDNQQPGGFTEKVTHVALVITDDEYRYFAVKVTPDDTGFTLPIYQVDPHRFSGDIQWNARASFQEDWKVSHEDGHWTPCATAIMAEGQIRTYVVEFIKQITLPAGYAWISCKEFVNRALSVHHDNALVQQSQAIATVALATLSMSLHTLTRFWAAQSPD